MRDEKADSPKRARGKRTNASTTVRPVLSFRAQADLYEKVKGRADASQRAISEELESLVRFALEITENRATEYVMRYIGTSISLAEMTTQKKWNEDKNTAVMANAAASMASNMLLMPFHDQLGKDVLEEKSVKVGEVLALRTVGIYGGLTADQVQDIGRDRMTDYLFTEVEQRSPSKVTPSILAQALRAHAPTEPVPEPTDQPTSAPKRRAKAKARTPE